MAYRYLIYATGTTYATTIKRESATNNPGAFEASLYTDFVIPEIQPLYLWRVTGGTDVVPNIDSNIFEYGQSIAPPAQPTDLVTYSELTGNTANKIDKVTGQASKLAVFTADGNVQSGGYTIPELTGLTTYTFVESGGTQITQVGNTITIYTTTLTGTTVSWGDITGTLSNQTDLWDALTGKTSLSVFQNYTGVTAPSMFASKNSAFTGVTTSGTGTTLINNTNNRVATLKSISTRGGVKLYGDGSNIILSGATTLPTTWGDITGTLSNQTDLWNVLTGKTENSTFIYYTGTTVPNNYYNKTQINQYSASTLNNINSRLLTTAFNTFTGTTLPANYYNKSQINAYTASTGNQLSNKVDKVTGATANNIATFVSGGNIQDSGKQFTNTVQSVGLATNNRVPTELAVRTAINQAVAAAVILQGDWNANTNIPDLTVTGITTGFAWRVSVGGTTSLGGITPWYVGDLAIKSVTGWIKVDNQDISAIWGNIVGTLSGQTDLWNVLQSKQATITGAATTITDTNLTANRALISNSGGKVAVSTTTSTELTYLSGVTSNIQTQLNSKLETSVFNSYSANTQSQINNKLDTSVFTGYTATTKNKDKKIQVVSTGTINVNTVAATPITWNTANPYATDMFGYTGGSSIILVKIAGTYEVQYGVVLKNDAANQTKSVGGYLIKNSSTTIPLTATASMVVGPNASGQLSLPPAVITLAENDKIQLAAFRIGNAGTVNTVSGSVFLIMNMLT